MSPPSLPRGGGSQAGTLLRAPLQSRGHGQLWAEGAGRLWQELHVVSGQLGRCQLITFQVDRSGQKLDLSKPRLCHAVDSAAGSRDPVRTKGVAVCKAPLPPQYPWPREATTILADCTHRVPQSPDSPPRPALRGALRR